MTKAPRWLCAMMALILALTGSLGLVLAPRPAGAQVMSASTPVPGEEKPANLEPTDGDRAAAGIMSVLYVPAKLITCTLGTAATIGLLALTFGNGYREAKSMFVEGCGGSWVITPEEVSGKVPPRSDM